MPPELVDTAATSPTTATLLAGVADAPDNLHEAAGLMMLTLERIWLAFLQHLPLLLIGLLIIFLTWVVARLVRKSVDRLVNMRPMRPSLRELFKRFASIAVWTVGLIFAALIIFPGLTPTKALGGLGLLSIAVGFAFKDIFENFFAGILILWKFPFEPGDYIECEGIMGKIENITVRQTLIRQPSGELIITPNSFLFNNPVTVLTSRPKRRISITAGVAYGENLDEAVRLVRQVVSHCGTVDSSKPVEVFPMEFGESSMNFEVAWWTDPTPLDVRRSRGEVVAAIKRGLDQAGIEIPFPYRTLTFKEPLRIQNQPPGEESPGGNSGTGPAT